MENAQIWDFKTRSYSPYKLPIGAILYSADLDELTRCAACGIKMTFGSGYTSGKIHNRLSFGYCVCKSCYEKEWKERAKVAPV